MMVLINEMVSHVSWMETWWLMVNDDGEWWWLMVKKIWLMINDWSWLMIDHG
jgi:hypothetical protein